MKAPLAIVGYGKMGRLVEQLAPEYGCEVRARFSHSNISTLSRETLQGASIAIEFTTPAAAPANLRQLATLGVNTVCGTTGWYEELPSVRQVISEAKTALVYGPNFSIGVNVFMDIVTQAASWLAMYEEYQAWGWEIHHSAKKDAPSGTLKRLVQDMRDAKFNRPITLSSNRAGSHPGTHEIGFDSPADTITIRHTARSREGFARGALQAARWIAGKQGVFEFRELLTELRSLGAAAS